MTNPIQVTQGDALTELGRLPDESVHCCVTSPPYWGLRDYGTADWEGGDPGCDHSAGTDRNDSGKREGALTGGPLPGGTKYHRHVCPKCGARRIDAQIGLEPTPEAYVASLVEVFRQVRRVLIDDGTLWLNLGDSYSAGTIGRTDHGSGNPTSTLGPQRDGLPDGTYIGGKQRPCPPGMKPKDLVGIPWRVAFALQADGWYLRQDIIWSKPNPMPESVRDRCTKAHEYVFLLSKSSRYYYDAEAVKEESVYPDDNRKERQKPEDYAARMGDSGQLRAVISPSNARTYPYRNRRSVWTVPTAPYQDAHFATYPPDLIRPCIRAGCPPDGTVLDPFAGSGTTGMVALEEARRAILIELNPEYIPMIEKRCHVTMGLGI